MVRINEGVIATNEAVLITGNYLVELYNIEASPTVLPLLST